MKSIWKFNEDGVFNHQDEGRYTGGYYYPIADIKPFMERNGFETVDLVSSNGIGGRLTEAKWEYWRNRGDDEFNKLMEIIYETASDPYLLGISSHLLYIGKKK